MELSFGPTIDNPFRAVLRLPQYLNNVPQSRDNEMTKEEIRLQRHCAFKVVLTVGLNERLTAIAKELGCRKSDIMRELLTNGIKDTYKGVGV